MPMTYVAERRCSFAQRIGAIDDRREAAALDELLELEQVLPLRRLDERPQGLAHEAEHHHPEDEAAATGEPALVEPSAVRHEDPGGGQRAAEIGQRMVRHV